MPNVLMLEKLHGKLLAQNVLIYAVLRTLSPQDREALKIAYAAESERVTEELMAFPSTRDFRNGFEDQINVQLQRLYAFRCASSPD